MWLHDQKVENAKGWKKNTTLTPCGCKFSNIQLTMEIYSKHITVICNVTWTALVCIPHTIDLLLFVNNGLFSVTDTLREIPLSRLTSFVVLASVFFFLCAYKYKFNYYYYFLNKTATLLDVTQKFLKYNNILSNHI